MPRIGIVCGTVNETCKCSNIVRRSLKGVFIRVTIYGLYFPYAESSDVYDQGRVCRQQTEHDLTKRSANKIQHLNAECALLRFVSRHLAILTVCSSDCVADGNIEKCDPKKHGDSHHGHHNFVPNYYNCVGVALSPDYEHALRGVKGGKTLCVGSLRPKKLELVKITR